MSKFKVGDRLQFLDNPLKIAEVLRFHRKAYELKAEVPTVGKVFVTISEGFVESNFKLMETT